MDPTPDDVARLLAVIDEQQHRLDCMRAEAAARSLLDVASGILVERLSSSPGEAAAHLARLAAETGASAVELAADLINLAADDPLVRAAGEATVRLPPVHRLAEVAVGNADTGDELAEILLKESLKLAGATTMALWVLMPDGALELIGTAGLEPLESSRWRRIPPQMDALPQRVVRDREAIWWGRPPEQKDPIPPLSGPWPGGARAVLPLSADGLVIGAMEMSWADGLPGFSPAVRAELLSLAHVCARTISAHFPPDAMSTALDAEAVLGALTESFLILSPVRAADGRIVDLRIDRVGLGDGETAGWMRRDLVGQRLSHVLPNTALAGGLVDRGIGVLSAGGRENADLPADAVFPAARVRMAPLFDRLVVAWRPAADTDRLLGLLEQVERLGDTGGWHQELLTGQVVWTPRTFALFGLHPTASAVGLDGLSRYVHPQDREVVRRFREQLLRHRQPAVATFRLIRSDEAVREIRASGTPVADPTGLVVAVCGAYQDVSARYQSQIVLAATQEQLADTEQRAEDQERLALLLQQAIMPRSVQPVSAAGLSVAVRYRPAGKEHLVGGDWYDATVLPNKKVLIAVGDIAGHGLEAVTGMTALSKSLHALAITDAGPAELLTWLNGITCHMTESTYATAVCGLYDPANQTLRWSRAGHLPPLLIRGGVAAALPLPGGLLLGLDPEARYEEMTTTLELGDALLLFTDGLIERRDMPLQNSLEMLVRLASRPIVDAESLSDQLIDGTRANTDDDACLVTIHLP